EITRLFNEYVPKEELHTYSLDVRLPDPDGTETPCGGAEEVAVRIRDDLHDTWGGTATIRTGPNRVRAKLCLALRAKQSGIARWTYTEIPNKLWPVTPLSRMWGIGSRLEKRLHRMGISTVGQLANYSLPRLEKTFGVIGSQL